MAESTLSLGYPDLCAAVGRYLGFGATSANWSATQLATIDRCVNNGYRKFLTCEDLPDTGHHEWSFLRPVTTLSTVASDYDYDLPDDCGGVEGEFSFATTDGQLGPIRMRGEGVIRHLREGNVSTGVPTIYAVRPKAGTGTTGQRLEVIFWPTPNAVWTLTYRYTALVGKLTDALPYPLGGARHAQTILAACIADAETTENDEKGLKYQDYIERMRASIKMDRKRFERDYHGYNGDHSDGPVQRVPIPRPISYNGVYYP